MSGSQAIDLPFLCGNPQAAAADHARNAAEREARHSVHRIESRDRIRGAKGSASARDIRSRSRRNSASGRKIGL